MTPDFPKSQKKELLALIDSFNESDAKFLMCKEHFSKLELELDTAKRERQDALNKITENTFSWKMFYELNVLCADKDKYWLSTPGLGGEFIETEEEAFKQLEYARTQVLGQIGKRIETGPKILDCNIHFESIT